MDMCRSVIFFGHTSLYLDINVEIELVMCSGSEWPASFVAVMVMVF